MRLYFQKNEKCETQIQIKFSSVVVEYGGLNKWEMNLSMGDKSAFSDIFKLRI